MPAKYARLLGVLRKVGILVGFAILLRQLYLVRADVTSFLEKPHNWGMIAVSLLLTLVAAVVQISIWYLVLRLFDVKARYVRILLRTSLFLLPKYIPGTVWGYISRSEWLKQEMGIEQSTSNAATVLEIAFILSAILIISPWYFGWGTLYPVLIIVLTTAGFYLVLLWLSRKPLKNPVIGTDRLKSPSMLHIMLIQAMGIAVWGIFGLSFYFLTEQPLNLLLTGGGIILAARFGLTFSIAWLIGFAIFFIPSGLGIREGTFSSLLLQQNLLTSATLYYAIVFRVLITLSELILIGCGLLSFSGKVIRPAASTDENNMPPPGE